MQDDRAKGTEGYTALTNDLFSIADDLPNTGDGQAASSIEAIRHMPEAWEALGQERAIMMAVLGRSQPPGKKQISDNEIMALTEAEAGLRRSLAAFYEGSSADQRRALDGLTNGTASEGVTGVPAHQAVNEVIAGGGTALTLESYVASSNDFVRGLQEVLVASAQEIAKEMRADRDDATRTALAAVVLTLAVVSVLVVILIVLVVLLVVLVSGADPRTRVESVDRVGACPTSTNGSTLSKRISRLGEACWSPSPAAPTAPSSWRPRPELWAATMSPPRPAFAVFRSPRGTRPPSSRRASAYA